LDELLNLPMYGQHEIQQLNDSQSSLDDLSQMCDGEENNPSPQLASFGIYSPKKALMIQCVQSPEDALELLEVSCLLNIAKSISL